MQEPNFKCPKTGKEYYIPTYKSVLQSDGSWVYKDKYGKELLSEEGERLVVIEKEFKGFPTAIYGDTNQRIAKRQQFFKDRAKKHSNSLDEKIRKAERTKEELNNLKNK